MMKTPSRKTVGPSSGACPRCGTQMKNAHGVLRYPVNGELVAVRHAAHLRCPKCKEVVLRLAEARRLGEDAISNYRAKHGLLSADEIRAIRERFVLTQGDLGKLLHLGQNTVSRWEAGRNAQTGAMDVLLRLLRDVPGSLEYLKRHAA